MAIQDNHSRLLIWRPTLVPRLVALFNFRSGDESEQLDDPA